MPVTSSSTSAGLRAPLIGTSATASGSALWLKSVRPRL